MKVPKHPKILLAALIAYSLGAFLLAFSPFGGAVYFSPSDSPPTQNIFEPYYATISFTLLAITVVFFIFLIFSHNKLKVQKNATT